jgi:hypothetical protein
MQGQDHAERAQRHDAEAHHHGTLVADALDQLRRRNRGHEIRDEPDRLDQRGLRVIEVEYAPEMGQQRVVDDRDKAPHEEEACEQREGRAVAALIARRGPRRGRCDARDRSYHQTFPLIEAALPGPLLWNSFV